MKNFKNLSFLLNRPYISCLYPHFLCIYYYKIGDYADLIYHIELEINDETDTARSALYFDLHHLHEVSFIRMKEKAVEKRNAVGTNRNADTSSNNMLSINKHFDDVSFRALLDRIRGACNIIRI
jgi:hypothetical protein